MKKLYFLILGSICTASLQGQVYYPMLDSISNTWTFIANMVPVRLEQQSAATCNYNNSNLTSEIFTLNDTLIGNDTYKVLYLKDNNSGMPDCLFGYIREDTTSQKIYFIDNLLSQPVLIYDFSLQVGDTISVDFNSLWGSYYQDGIYQVDSISTITIQAGPRRIFYLSIPGIFTPYPLEWIEGVGHPGHLIYPYSLNFSAGMMFWCNDPIARDFYHLLTCFEQSSVKVYFDSCAHAFAFNNWCFNYVDSCNYWNICGSLEENGLLTDFSISPNPSSEIVTVSIAAKRNAHARLEVLDISGKSVLSKDLIIRQGANRESLDMGNLGAGSYQVVLKLDEGSVTRKLVRAPW